MPDPRRARLDDYGRPRSGPTDVRYQYLGDSPENQEQKRYLYALLESKLRDILRRGAYGQLHICCYVKDGTLQLDSTVGLHEQLRNKRQE